jgi:sulfur-oxidizing protein SoxZ
MARTLIHAPRSARRGEIIEIRTLISHPMETGFRRDSDGRPLPRDLVQRFSCRYDGQVVFAAELFAAVAANPYIAFSTVATSSGNLTLTWEGDHGFAHTETLALTVT